MIGSLSERLDNLSPAKRALLEMKLRGKTVSPVTAVPIRPRREAQFAPPSPNQESLLFLDRLNPNASTYNLYDAYRLVGKLNQAALQKTIDQLVLRHEALRTTFREVEGQPQQIIAPPGSVIVQQIDLHESQAEDREIVAGAVLRQEMNRPLDLCEGPLFRVVQVTLSESENWLLIVLHHIISDGWSLGLFWREFAELYSSYTSGVEPSLPVLPIQFGDYSIWARHLVERSDARQTEYWQHQLAGAPALLELPTDRPRPAVQTFRGAQVTTVFDSHLCQNLKHLSQQEGVTLFMTLLAGFSILLSRYSGQEDLVIGSPTAGRTRVETENLIGFFVNTLALRIRPAGEMTLRELLAQVKATALGAYSNQELPFERVVAALQPERSLSHNLIYQVAFALENYSEPVLDLPGLSMHPVELGSITSKFDLFLSAREVTEGISVTVEYSRDLFDQSTIQRLLHHYRNLLDAITTGVNKRISTLPMLSPDELRQKVVDWNQTDTDYRATLCLHELFEERAAADPEAVAVTGQQGDLSYGELNQRANQIAHYLRAKGVTPGMPVGILLDRSPLSVAAITGVLKAGGAYLPLDPGYPVHRLQFMLEHSEARFVLTTRELASHLPEGIEPVLLDTHWDLIEAGPDINLSNQNTSDDAAYLIFTSGSTGEPKGTLIPHRAVHRLVSNTNYVDLDSSDRIAHISNISFDAATFELWGALINGARLVIVEKETVLNQREFISELRTRGVTTMFVTTALFNLIARDEPSAFASLRTVMFGGEACDPASARRVIETAPPERLLHVYGPTEATTFATWHEVNHVALDAQTIPIGRPISNTTIYILDKRLNPVPVGVPGEIFIGGDGLALGYLKRPELTGERFINVSLPAPSQDQGGGTVEDRVRLYRTGDVARYLLDGSIEFIGRRDHQVKLRGFRIELGEIETAISAHQGVRDCVVLVRERAGEKTLVAYYSALRDTQLAAAELREYLAQRLPDYMIPQMFLEVPGLSLNSNGKLDRNSLPSIDEHSPANAEGAVEPKDELELRLTWIWEKLLGKYQIGVKDNFFECGGHSLIAVRLFSEIERSIGCQLPLATLFQAPTIEGLARVIREGGWQNQWEALVPLRSHGTRPPFFCVHAVGGNVLEYHHLAKHLDPDQPFFGFQSLGLDGRSAPLETIEEMATAYIREMREIQPGGPYYLGGRSFGGTVAYEMARQLVEAGETVALLAMLDSYPLGWLRTCDPGEAEHLKRHFFRLRIRRHLQIWGRFGLMGKVGYVIGKARYKKRRLNNLLWRFGRKLGLGNEPTVDSTIREVEETNYLATRKYVPRHYPGTVTFFCALEEVSEGESIAGWNRIATGGVEVVRVPGDHQTMIEEPFVKVLAEKLGNSISDAAKKGIE